MRYPNESLEEYRARKLKPIDPPEVVSLEPTGETEVLKPLASWDGPIRTETRRTNLRSAWFWFSWFHRSLAMGGGLALVTFVVGTGLYLAIYGPPANGDADIAELAADPQMPDLLTLPDRPFASDNITTDDLPYRFDEVKNKPLTARRSFTRPRAGRVVYRAPRVVREPLRPQMWVSQFIPTTLIIYIENGEIKSRIEPQLNAGFKRPSAN